MHEYTVEVKLLSETILGAGAGNEGVVNSDVVRNSDGFHYIKASTFKGLVREQLEWFNDILPSGCKQEIEALLGKPNFLGGRGKLKFWDLNTTSDSNQDNEVIRYQTAVDSSTGVAKDGSLRSMKVIREGDVFQGRLTTDEGLTDTELQLLNDAIKAIKHLGTNRTRGKGRVACELVCEPACALSPAGAAVTACNGQPAQPITTERRQQ